MFCPRHKLMSTHAQISLHEPCSHYISCRHFVHVNMCISHYALVYTTECWFRLSFVAQDGFFGKLEKAF